MGKLSERIHLLKSGPLEGNLEQAGREARRKFFRSYLDSGQLDRIALGHTRNDQAETLLFRLLRGTGPAGLGAIRPVTADGLVRPLLDTTRALVCEFPDAGFDTNRNWSLVPPIPEPEPLTVSVPPDVASPPPCAPPMFWHVKPVGQCGSVGTGAGAALKPNA